MEKAAVVLRVAPTWFRMGSLEILSRNGEIQELRNLVDFVRKVNFPDIEEETDCRERPSTGATHPSGRVRDMRTYVRLCAMGSKLISYDAI